MSTPKLGPIIRQARRRAYSDARAKGSGVFIAAVYSWSSTRLLGWPWHAFPPKRAAFVVVCASVGLLVHGDVLGAVVTLIALAGLTRSLVDGWR